ncbi:hypothetical protein [Heyndrickxia acidicola]|uniref:HTH dtxR-type domain-containing protein n=1 Tax=Heyndrickxia acidicola TaxID=209389 RepID=A0ABU6MHJ6_9BACI|nr:hypothetical protein [Heyndrickxia acidicola]MED1204139.1 hypothetical protein [Heyndrickxia acidicola]
MDIAALPNVLPSSATKMIQRLDEMGFVVYEKYREFILSKKGRKQLKAWLKRISY